MKKLIPALMLPVLFFAACSSSPKKSDSGVVQKTKAYEVVDTKNSITGGSIPQWVEVYLDTSSISAVEALDQYKDKYLFITEETGADIAPLQQWSRGFSVAQEMARMVSNRVEAKFVGAAVGSADKTNQYGTYMEDVVKNVASATFSGARQDGDYWIQRRHFGPDGKTVTGEDFTLWILVTIDKGSLEQQINNILNGTTASTPLTREQEAAVDLVKQSMYEGF